MPWPPDGIGRWSTCVRDVRLCMWQRDVCSGEGGRVRVAPRRSGCVLCCAAWFSAAMQAQTEHMERQYAKEDNFMPPLPVAATGDNAADMAAQLAQVARLVCRVKGQLLTMRDRLEIPLSGFDVPAAQVDLPCSADGGSGGRSSGAGEAPSADSGGSSAFRRFRRVVSQVQVMQRGTRMLRKGEATFRLREEAETNAASFL